MTDNSEVTNDKGVGTVKSQVVTDRRKLFRRLVALAGLGITGVLLSQPQTGLLPQVHATDMVIDVYNDGIGETVLQSSGTTEPAFLAIGGGGGLWGIGNLDGANGVLGQALGGGGVGVLGKVEYGDGIPILAQGAEGQTANLQEWGKLVATLSGSVFLPLSAVDYRGFLGLLTFQPNNTLHVCGTSTIESVLQYENANGNSWIFWNDRGSSLLQFQYAASGQAPVTHWYLTPTGQMHTQDIVLKNGLTFTEDGGGVAFKNDTGEKIAVLDRNGNFRVKGRVVQDQAL